MLKHGENIIDTLGAEVDRLEKELKVSHSQKALVIESTASGVLLLCGHHAECVSCVRVCGLVSPC